HQSANSQSGSPAGPVPPWHEYTYTPVTVTEASPRHASRCQGFAASSCCNVTGPGRKSSHVVGSAKARNCDPPPSAATQPVKGSEESGMAYQGTPSTTTGTGKRMLCEIVMLSPMARVFSTGAEVDGR